MFKFYLILFLFVTGCSFEFPVQTDTDAQTDVGADAGMHQTDSGAPNDAGSLPDSDGRAEDADSGVLVDSGVPLDDAPVACVMHPDANLRNYMNFDSNPMDCSSMGRVRIHMAGATNRVSYPECKFSGWSIDNSGSPDGEWNVSMVWNVVTFNRSGDSIVCDAISSHREINVVVVMIDCGCGQIPIRITTTPS